MWAIAVDDQGNLHKCWEAVDKQAISFGNAHDWNPASPLESATNLDNLTKFLNTAIPNGNEECHECVWLPLCTGGCPFRRMNGDNPCVKFKNDPESYVMALHARIGEGKHKE